MSASSLVAIIVSGLTLGSIYALVSSGLSLMWSTLQVFNFGHGALLALGAYLGWTLSQRIGNLALAIVIVLPLMFVISIFYQFCCIRPFIRRPQGDLLVMVSTLAAGTLIANVIQLFWGPASKSLPSIAEGVIRFGGASIGGNQAAIIVIAPVVMLATVVFLKYTRVGLAIRAVEQNREYARLLSIKPETVYLTVIGLAAMLAGLAGMLLGATQFIAPTMGNGPLLRAFAVVVFGGLATVQGTVYAAYLIGMLEAISTYFLGLFWTPVLILGVIVLVMVVRPEGLVARRART